MFTTTTCFYFFAKFNGYNDHIALKFTKGFDGKVASIGVPVIGVSNKTLAQATKFSQEGEKCFTNKLVEKHVCI